MPYGEEEAYAAQSKLKGPPTYMKSSGFKMAGMTFKADQAPIKKLSLKKVGKKVREGLKKVKDKIEDWKEKHPKTSKALETAGDAIAENFGGESPTAEPVVMDSATPPSQQSTVAPDVTKLVSSEGVPGELPDAPKGPTGPKSPKIT